MLAISELAATAGHLPTPTDGWVEGCEGDLMAAAHSHAHACRGARDSCRGWQRDCNLLLLLLLLEQRHLKLLLLDLNLLLGELNLLLGNLDLLLLLLLLNCMQAMQPSALFRAPIHGNSDRLPYCMHKNDCKGMPWPDVGSRGTRSCISGQILSLQQTMQCLQAAGLTQWQEVQSPAAHAD